MNSIKKNILKQALLHCYISHIWSVGHVFDYIVLFFLYRSWLMHSSALTMSYSGTWLRSRRAVPVRYYTHTHTCPDLCWDCHLWAFSHTLVPFQDDMVLLRRQVRAFCMMCQRYLNSLSTVVKEQVSLTCPANPLCPFMYRGFWENEQCVFVCCRPSPFSAMHSWSSVIRLWRRDRKL